MVLPESLREMDGRELNRQRGLNFLNTFYSGTSKPRWRACTDDIG